MPIDYKKTGIYFIKNTITKKYYIGSSINIQKRFWQYDFLLRNKKCHSPKLQNSYNKYGKDNFEFGLIEECIKDDLKDKEAEWIKHFNSVDNGYNCSNDTTCSTRGRKMTAEERLALSKRNKERWKNDDGKMLAISQTNAKKATEKRRGSKNSTEHNLAISLANRGSNHSELTKQRISASKKEKPFRYWLGKKRSVEDRLKMSLSHIGKTGELHPCSKPIIQYDLIGNEMARHISAADCARKDSTYKRSGIKECLNGRNKTYKQSIWKYASV
jgi:group I intron endonuclease